MNIGAAMSGGASSAAKKRREENPDEYFPTPEGTTRALLPVLDQIGWPKHVWENACGNGHISKVLIDAGYDVFSTNLCDRGYGRIGVNFLSQTKAHAPSIITNPPFSLADQFLDHAVTLLGIEHVAMLLPATIYHAQRRVALFEQRTPSLILPLTWRLDVTGGGSPTMNCSWYLWTTLAPPVSGYRPLVSTEKTPGRYDVQEAA